MPRCTVSRLVAASLPHAASPRGITRLELRGRRSVPFRVRLGAIHSCTFCMDLYASSEVYVQVPGMHVRLPSTHSVIVTYTATRSSVGMLSIRLLNCPFGPNTHPKVPSGRITYCTLLAWTPQSYIIRPTMVVKYRAPHLAFDDTTLRYSAEAAYLTLQGR